MVMKINSSESAAARERFGVHLGERWRAGDRLPSIRELADQIGVSHGTAQRTVQEMVRSGFLVAQPRRGVFVSHQFTDAQLRAIFAKHAVLASPSSLRPLAGKRIVIHHSSDSTHLLPTLEALETALVLAGGSFVRRPYKPTNENIVNTEDADAVVLLNPDTPWTIHSQPGQHVLVVTSAATLPTLTTTLYDHVTIDQEQGASLAGRHLRQAGCVSTCFIGVASGTPPAYRKTSQLRLSGFEEGWGARIKPEHQFHCDYYSPLGGAIAARAYALLSPRPQGIFVVSDDVAVGFISGLAALGLDLGRDYKLVGFDGQKILQQLHPAGVSSVHVPAIAMGKSAVDLLVSRFQSPDWPLRRVMLGCQLHTGA